MEEAYQRSWKQDQTALGCAARPCSSPRWRNLVEICHTSRLLEPSDLPPTPRLGWWGVRAQKEWPLGHSMRWVPLPRHHHLPPVWDQMEPVFMSPCREAQLEGLGSLYSGIWEKINALGKECAVMEAKERFLFFFLSPIIGLSNVRCKMVSFAR